MVSIAVARRTITIVAMLAAMLPSIALAWRLDMNFNDGVHGTVARGDLGGGAFTSPGSGSYYTTEISYEGGMAVELNVQEGCTCYGVWGGTIRHPQHLRKGDELWFRVRTYMPTGFNWDSYAEGSHLKFIRFHTQSPDGNNEGYNDWYINRKDAAADVSHKFIFEGGQGWTTAADKSQFPVLGVWETYEMYVKFDNVPVALGGGARIRLWKNGILLKDITDKETLKSADSVSDRTHLFTYWNGGAPKTQKMYVDDMVLTSDRPAALDARGNAYVGADAILSSAPSAPMLEVK